MGKLQTSRSRSAIRRRRQDGSRPAAPSRVVPPAAVSTGPASSLQRARRLGHNVVQTKLTLGPADDHYERQADAVARQVMQDVASPSGEVATAQRQMEDEELDEVARPKRVQRQPDMPEEDKDLVTPKRLQRSTMTDGGPLSAEVESGIESARSGGRPLDDAVRTKMEPAFGADLGGVRVHTGARSDGLNQSLQSRAFTTGPDIFFRSGEYKPGSSSGQELLAHELTHVVQQGAAQAKRRG